MVNTIKGEYGGSGAGLRLQVTKEARKAGLVAEDSDGNPTDLSDVLVYGFDGLLVVVGEWVSMADRAELVASAARDTDSIHEGAGATLAVAGGGYQVQLPGCKVAGFSKGDRGHVRAADGVLFIHDGTQGRLIDDLMTVRK